MGHRIRGHKFGVVGDFGGVPLGYYAQSDFGTLVMSMREAMYMAVRDEFPGKQIAVRSLSQFNTMPDYVLIEGDTYFRNLLFASPGSIDMYDVWVADAYHRMYVQCKTGVVDVILVGEDRKRQLKEAHNLNKALKSSTGWTYGRVWDSLRALDRLAPPHLDALYAVLGFTVDQRLSFDQYRLASQGLLHIAQFKANLDRGVKSNKGRNV